MAPDAHAGAQIPPWSGQQPAALRAIPVPGEEDDRPHDAGGGAASSSSATSKSKKRKLTTESFTRRKRAATACQFCRLRKTKCDTERPACGYCVYHRAKCIYDDQNEHDPPAVDNMPEYMVQLGETILLSLGEVKQLLSQPRDEPLPHRQPQQPEQQPQQPCCRDFLTNTPHVADNRRSSSSSNPLAHPRQPVSSKWIYAFTRCETMLRWPVFKGLIDEKDAEIESFLFEVGGDSENFPAPGGSPSSSRSLLDVPAPIARPAGAIDENAFVPLCRKFLVHVYPRNPILDKSALISYAKSAAANGLQWNASSCLVLLACALASFTTAWEPPISSSPSTDQNIDASGRHSTATAVEEGHEDNLTARAYYEAAKKRIGALGSSLIDIQCLFFASVFEKYALRPLDAWFYVQMACMRLEALLLRRGYTHLHNDGSIPTRTTMTTEAMNNPTYLLEQRVFWTCIKAESELMPELGFRPSGLSDLGYPDLFPTPPTTFAGATQQDEVGNRDAQVVSQAPETQIDENRSWLFYLAEISLRRTIDDVLWLFYHRGEDYWMNNVDLLTRQYVETDRQIELWYSHLPPSIRFERLGQAENEYAFFLQHRFLDWRENILRPLLYIFLHHPGQLPCEVVQCGREAMQIASELIILSSQHHRHGSIWFVAYRTFACAMLILAVVIRYGDAEAPADWQWLITLALQTLRRWGLEARDIALMHTVLERLYTAVRQRDSDNGDIGRR